MSQDSSIWYVFKNNQLPFFIPVTKTSTKTVLFIVGTKVDLEKYAS